MTETSLEDEGAAGVPPHAAEADSLLGAAGVEADRGLSSAEAARRLKAHGPNMLAEKPRARWPLILVSQFASPIVYLLLAAAGLALMLGEVIEFVAIAVVLAINAAIGFFTELQAVRSMEALRELADQTGLVRRDGTVRPVPAKDLVPGDIAIIDAGDIVNADMRVIQAANLSADESVLTGESMPVSKSAAPVAPDTVLAERTSMLYKGSAITGGTGEALVTGTGMKSELGRITRLVREAAPQRSPLERQLARLSRHLIWLTLAVTAVVAIVGIASGRNFLLMIESAVALAVAAIPEGLPIVATLALARGMLRMARHNALIEQLSAVETLGATTVIMTDKTGTLTENRMHVECVVTSAGEHAFDRQARSFSDGDGPDLAVLLRNAALCSNATLSDGDDNGTGDGTGEPMEIALLEAAVGGGLDRPSLLERFPEEREVAFDTATRMMATVHRSGEGWFVAVKGAPEAVFERVAHVAAGGEARPFDTDAQSGWDTACARLADRGLRLLAIAGRDAAGPETPVYEDLTLYGVVGFQDPPRPDVEGAISDARRAGISVVMVTGDHAATARHISGQVGLAHRDSEAVGGKELKPYEELSPEERTRLRAARVFSRVDPEQKLSLIRLHQEAGEVVAMTGDGVNDAPALQQADIGIAMGRRGTQVARQAADLVLRDDAFPTIMIAVREGRQIYTNIRRFTTYLLSCNLSEILIVGLAVASGLPLPLLPLQILFLNLVTDVFPAFALGAIEADRDVLRRPPRPPSEPILARPQWMAIAAHGTIIAAVTLVCLLIAIEWFGLSGDPVTTMTFHTLALAQLWHVFNMRNWRDHLSTSKVTRNRYVWGAIALCLAILAVANLEPHLAAVLKLAPLSPTEWATVLVLSFVPVVAREGAAAITRLRRRSKRDAE